jgi:C-terminal processing protease CtpA/Prc
MRIILRLCCALVLIAVCVASTPAQQLEKNIDENRKHGLKMLKDIKAALKEHYYDPTFHGLDLDARFQLAAEKVQQATTGGQVFGIIAQAVLDLNDSHTKFFPPEHGEVTVYGWRMQMFGDICYITAVVPGSDAEAKGLKAGDRVLSLDGYEPTRDTLWKMYYYYYTLRPKTRVRVTVQSPAGGTREVEVLTKAYQIYLRPDLGMFNEPPNPDLEDGTGPGPHYAEFGSDLIICRLPSFELWSSDVDKVMKKIAGHKSLVLDLRANPGGYATTLARFVGYFFDREVKVADLRGSKGVKEVSSRPSKSNNFTGKLIVLVDSRSSSASEVFARLVQLEKRGIVIGDHTLGRVMEGRYYELTSGTQYNFVTYGLYITDANIIMSDGQSLEGRGVAPDELLLPTTDDISGRRDPVMARAAALAGVQLTAEEAGSLFSPKNKKATR